MTDTASSPVTASGSTARILEELIRRPSGELHRMSEKGLPGGLCRWVEALRGEAGRYYNTDAATARRIAARALELAEISGLPLALGWGHRAMAESFLYSGRMREAEASYAKAERAWREANATGLLGQLLVGRIHVLSLLGRHDETRAATMEARRNLESAGDRAYLAKLAMNLGNMHFQRDEYGPALEEYDRASTLFARLRVRDEAVVGLEVNRGMALSELGRNDEALALFNLLGKECERRGYDLLLAQVRMNAGYVHSLRADFDLALQGLSSATSYFRETEHPAFLAACYVNRAEIYQQLNLHREALQLAEEAIPLFAREGLVYDEALANSQGALSCLAQGDLPSAMRRIRRGRLLFEQEKNPSRVALMQVLWAEALYQNRRWNAAEARARKALEAFQRLGLVRWEASAAVLLARLEERRLSPQAQIPRLRGLLRKIPRRIYPVPAYQLLEALGRAEERAGRPVAAARSYRGALLRLEELRVRIPTEDSKIAFLRGKTHLYDRMLAIEMDRARPAIGRIFEWMERSRAQTLWDRLRSPGAYFDPGGGDAAALDVRGRTGEKLAAMRRHLSWLHSRLSRLELGSEAERAQALTLRRSLARAEESWSRALRERAESKAGNTRRARPNATKGAVPSIPEITRSLPAGWGLLSYHVGVDFALLLMLTREGAAWRRLAPDLGAKLTRLAERLDFQWGAAAMSSVRKAQAVQASPPPMQGMDARSRILLASTDAILTEMHALLWKPIEEMGAHRSMRWIISPHGPIHRVPFHAMRDGAGYLAEQTDLTLIPSARIWRELPPLPRGLRKAAWIAGVPSPELPAVRVEVERVRQRLAGWRVTCDFAPTRESFRREGRSVDLVHLAAHGSLRKDNPAYSFVQLDDGPLFVHDLAGLRLPSSTVVLTACSSGRGAAPAGDEWIGLARGFLQAGASTVMASLWPIQDEPTFELIDLFYDGYANGLTAPEALGRAMRRLLPSRPHPWHWASFAVLGGI